MRARLWARGFGLSYLDVKGRKLSLAQRGSCTCTCGRCSYSCSCSAQLFCPREQCDQTDGEDGERKGPGRVFGAPPSLHCVQDGALVHGHNILLHARRCLGELPVLYRNRNAVAARRVKRPESQRGGEGGAIRILSAMQQSVYLEDSFAPWHWHAINMCRHILEQRRSDDAIAGAVAVCGSAQSLPLKHRHSGP
jgi:hypothetical protein